MSEEQRHDYPDILSRLSSIEKKVNGGLADQFKDLKEDNKRIWDKHDVEAREFRARTEHAWERVETKVDFITSRLDRLPCDARKPQWEWVTKNIYALWVVLGIIIAKVLIQWAMGTLGE